jgi:hypothetical protein
MKFKGCMSDFKCPRCKRVGHSFMNCSKTDADLRSMLKKCENCGSVEMVFKGWLSWTCVDCQGGHFNDSSDGACTINDCPTHKRPHGKWAHTYLWNG